MLSGGKKQTRRHNGLNASLSAAAIGAALRASGLLEAKQALPFSRCGFCSHPSYEHAIAKNDAALSTFVG